MQIYSNKLAAQLKSGLSPIYLIAGDELLLQNDACQLVREKAKTAGFENSQRFIQDTSFDWQTWLDACSSMSLFAEQRLIELRLSSSKIGAEGSKNICSYLEHPAEDTVILIIAPRIEGKPKWVNKIIADGTYVPVYPLDANQLPTWLQQRARSHQITLAQDAAQLLAERVEGNLMAAEQELQKLALMSAKNANISIDTIANSVADSARFSAFNMIDHAIDGDARSACRALQHIKEEGTEPVALLGAVAHQVRMLSSLKNYAKNNQLPNGFKALRVIPKKQQTITQALRRLDESSLKTCTQLAAHADLMTKSGESVMAWNTLELLLLKISGHSIANEHSVLQYNKHDDSKLYLEMMGFN